MAGAYQEIPIGYDFFFTTNVTTRVAALSANLTSANFSWVAREFDSDMETTLTNVFAVTSNSTTNGTISVNTTSKVATVSLNAAYTATALSKPLLYWMLTVNQANGLKYVLDQGRAATIDVPAHGAGGGVGA
jgi:uncharacterized membrane protein